LVVRCQWQTVDDLNIVRLSQGRASDPWLRGRTA
jgi:hypothetical protein